MTQWGLDTLFNPAKRHMDEEKRRLQSTREEVGDNSGGRRIDLESGKVVIRKADEQDEQDEVGAQQDTEAPLADTSNRESHSGAKDESHSGVKDESHSGAKDKPAPSAAAQRAAARRGRTAR